MQVREGTTTHRTSTVRRADRILLAIKEWVRMLLVLGSMWIDRSAYNKSTDSRETCIMVAAITIIRRNHTSEKI